MITQKLLDAIFSPSPSSWVSESMCTSSSRCPKTSCKPTGGFPLGEASWQRGGGRNKDFRDPDAAARAQTAEKGEILQVSAEGGRKEEEGLTERMA